MHIVVKIIRCDNAEGNKSFKKVCGKEGLNVKFEYTAVSTTQQNERVEQKLQCLYGHLRAKLLVCGITNMPIWNPSWTECGSTLTGRFIH